MGVIISVTNQKGGVGKTVTVSSLATILTQQGHRVLCVDMDPQRNLDFSAGRENIIAPQDTETKSLLHVLRGECELSDATVPTVLGDLVRASSLLTQWTGRRIVTAEEFETMSKKDFYSLAGERVGKGWEKGDAGQLSAEVNKIRDNYDYILLDTNPSLQLLTLNSLIAADYVLIPAFAEESSLEAIKELWDTISNINRNTPWKQLRVLGILLTNVSPRTIIAQRFINVFTSVAEQMGSVLFTTKIRRCISVAEYLTNRMPLVQYDPDGNATKDYYAFTNEFIERVKQMEAEKHG